MVRARTLVFPGALLVGDANATTSASAGTETSFATICRMGFVSSLELVVSQDASFHLMVLALLIIDDQPRRGFGDLELIAHLLKLSLLLPNFLRKSLKPLPLLGHEGF